MSVILSQRFTVITCYKCGIAFAVPDHFNVKRLESKEAFWCPNGHSQLYCESTADRLRRELSQKDTLLQQALNRERAALDSVKAAERKAKRLSKRLESGVCPHPGCKRHFTNLQRHITTEHYGVALPAAELQRAIEGPVQ